MRIFCLIILFSVFSLNLMAHPVQYYIKERVETLLEDGAKRVIVSASVCSACRGEVIYDGLLFVNDSLGDFKVIYLKYVNKSNDIEILKETVFEDMGVKEIFDVEKNYRGQIKEELHNMDSILTETFIINGRKVSRPPFFHGGMRYLGVFTKEQSVSSTDSIINLNALFQKAKHYWMLSSAINNYKEDYLEGHINND